MQLRSGTGDAILPKLAGLGKAAGEDNFVVPPRSYVVEATEAVAGVSATDPATVEWVTRYFGAGDQWYFLDAEEKTQGPFTGEVMTSWFKVCGVTCPSIRCGERGSLRFLPAGGLLLER